MTVNDKPLIVWDLDDVLNNLMEAWFCAYASTSSGSVVGDYQGIVQNPPHQLLGITHSEYLNSLDTFRNSAEGHNLGPNALVLDWFREKGSNFRHMVLTNRPVKTVPGAADWVFRHFGNWVRFFHFVPSPRSGEDLPAYDSNKGECLTWLGKADALVDDSPENIRAAQELGLEVFTFPQPWNDSEHSVCELLNKVSRISIRQPVGAFY